MRLPDTRPLFALRTAVQWQRVMGYHSLEPLDSKRNTVTAAVRDIDGLAVVIKDFAEHDSYTREAAMVTLLAANGLAVPPVLEQGKCHLVYRCIAGYTLLELLEQYEGSPAPTALPPAFVDLCHWLGEFYRITSRHTILEDAHLRNFIASPEGVYGIDFECCTDGIPEQDIAKLLILTATYYPELTPVKLAMAQLLYRQLQQTLALDKLLLRDSMVAWQQVMAIRRGNTTPDWLPDRIMR